MTLPSQQEQPPEFRRDIEAVRGVAILAVIGFHVGLPGFAGGYVGVDVFFVLSGYLITNLMLREYETSGTISLRSFYARRVRRLLPAATLALVAVAALCMAVYSPIEMLASGRTIQAAAVYASNLWFARSSIDYLAHDASVDPNLHTWSLGVEEQFYVVWPLFVLALLGRRSRRVLVIGIVILIASSFIACLFLTVRAQPWAFYTSPPRFWEFGLGALAAIVPMGLGDRLASHPATSIAALLGLVASIVTFDSATRFPGPWALLPAASTALLLRAGGATNQITVRVLPRPTLLWIGRHSYSWYLWHWPLIVVAKLLFGTSLVVSVAAAAIALLLSMATYRWIESPVRHSMRLRRPDISLLLGVGLVLVAFAAGTLLRAYAGRTSDTVEQQRFATASRDEPAIYRDGCTLGFLETTLDRDCRFGALGSRRTIVLFGDSHAAQWFPALDEIARQHHFELRVRIKAACPAASLPSLHSDRLRREYTECSRWRDQALVELAQLRPALVVMSSANTYVSSEGRPTAISPQRWQEALGATRTRLKSANVPFVWLADTPLPDSDVPRCLSRAKAAWIGRRDCRFERTRSLRDDVRTVEREVLGSAIIDLSNTICPGSTCDVERENVVLFSDSNHLSATYTRSLATELFVRLRPYLGE